MSDKSQTPSTSSPILPRGLVSRRGGLVNPSARMPSLRSPRDLTLGGKPKKSFKPNIPVRKDRTREEPKESTEASSSSTSKDGNRKSSRDGRGGGAGRGRGRGRGGRRQPETIQTHSIFEQGPLERSNRPRGSGAPSYGGAGDFTPKAGGGGVKKIIKKEDMDQDLLDDLLRDDFIDDLTATTDNKYNLVHLPLSASLPKKEYKDAKISKMEVDETDSKMDVDVKVKLEPGTTDVEMKDESKFVKPAPVDDKFKKPLKSKLHSKKDSKTRETTCADLFATDSFDAEGELVFFQLPDTLPSFPTSNDEEDRKPVIKKEKDAAGSSNKESKEPKNTCCLKDLPEGYLGKLQILKSGKARLKLGNITLDVSMGSPCGFLQDLVSVKLGGEKGGELITLGHINHRVVCTPNFEQLLQSGS